METPTLIKKYKNLENEVSLHDGSSSVSWLGKIDITKVYFILPLLVLIFLVLFRPKFLYTESIHNKDEKAFSFKQLFVYWLVISALLLIGWYAYNSKTPDIVRK